MYRLVYSNVVTVRIFAKCVISAIDRNSSSLPTNNTNAGNGAVLTAGMVQITEIHVC